MMDDSFYLDLVNGQSKLSKDEEVIGMDSFLTSDKIRVASLADLQGFFRISGDTLVHKAQKDLWSIKEKDGGFVIERLFDSNTKEPLKI